MYLKIGHGRRKPFKRSAEIAHWYRSDGDPTVRQKLTEMLHQYIQGTYFCNCVIGTKIYTEENTQCYHINELEKEQTFQYLRYHIFFTF